MRYLTIDTVTFTDKTGKQFPVKDMREIPAYDTMFTVTKVAGEMVDEIASREEVYGSEAEDQSFLILEHNLREVCEYSWDLDKLRSLRVPVQGNV
jgi:hypothetical protein